VRSGNREKEATRKVRVPVDSSVGVEVKMIMEVFSRRTSLWTAAVAGTSGRSSETDLLEEDEYEGGRPSKNSAGPGSG